MLLKNKQSHMIDSILERVHRRIKLDRILLDKDILTLDESEITDKITDHFQNYANWISDYTPQPDIPDLLYTYCTDPITIDELQSNSLSTLMARQPVIQPLHMK